MGVGQLVVMCLGHIYVRVIKDGLVLVQIARVSRVHF